MHVALMPRSIPEPRNSDERACRLALSQARENLMPAAAPHDLWDTIPECLTGSLPVGGGGHSDPEPCFLS